jgi:ferredoxin
MKIHVETIECAGHGQCHLVSPELYDLDDDGFSAVVDLDVPADQEDAAVRGANSCPARAITIIAD